MADRGVAGFEILAALPLPITAPPPLLELSFFSRQLGTAVSGFAGTIEAISQVHFGGKKGVTER
jgi:hypothetical protein